MKEAKRVDASQLAATLSEMDSQTKQGWALLKGLAKSDGEVRAAVTAFLERQIAALTELQQGRDADQRALTAVSFGVLDSIKGELASLR